MRRIPTFLLLMLVCLLSQSCGGSSGGGTFFSGAGFINIDASPRRIDTGNRTQIRSDIFDTHPEGVIVKFRYPHALMYVPQTAQLLVDGQSTSLDPDVEVATPDEVFLVFFFAQSDFGHHNHGVLTFELRANIALASGRIEVDLDVDDDFFNNEFDPDNPEFTAVDHVTVSIVD